MPEAATLGLDRNSKQDVIAVGDETKENQNEKK